MRETFFQVCDGCRHAVYDMTNNEIECRLGLEPKPSPSEPETPYCPSRSENEEDEYEGDD